MEETAHDQQDSAYTQIVEKLQRSIEVSSGVLMLLHPYSKPIVQLCAPVGALQADGRRCAGAEARACD